MAPSREAELEDTIELLRRQLGDAMGSDQELGTLMALKRGMTARMAFVLQLLVKRAPGVVSLDSFHTLVYGGQEDGGPEPTIFRVHVLRLRKFLKRVNCPGKIDTVWNAGYRADPQLVQWVKDLYSQNIPKE